MTNTDQQERTPTLNPNFQPPPLKSPQPWTMTALFDHKLAIVGGGRAVAVGLDPAGLEATASPLANHGPAYAAPVARTPKGAIQ